MLIVIRGVLEVMGVSCVLIGWYRLVVLSNVMLVAGLVVMIFVGRSLLFSGTMRILFFCVRVVLVRMYLFLDRIVLEF